MARAGPLRPAYAATTWLPDAATLGFGAPSDTLMIQAAAYPIPASAGRLTGIRRPGRSAAADVI